MVVTGLDEELRANAEVHSTPSVVATLVWIDIAAERCAGRRAADTNFPKRITSDHGNRICNRKLELAIVEAVSACGVPTEFLAFQELIRWVYSQAPDTHLRTQRKIEAAHWIVKGILEI
jgi:hypothetical protein